MYKLRHMMPSRAGISSISSFVAKNKALSQNFRSFQRVLVKRGFAIESPDDAQPPTTPALLTLEDGSQFTGLSFGAETSLAGEVVFSTGMVGYTESLTDPSYRGQILTLTYPMIGNYGVPDMSRMDEFGLPKGFESDRIHASALLVQDYSHHYSHWDAKQSLGSWLKQQGVPGLSGIDTRLLTKKIRDKGAMLGKIEFAPDEGKIAFDDPNSRNLLEEVSIKEPRIFGAGNPIKILALDCGIKYNIIRSLVRRGAEVKVVPYDHDIDSERGWYDGLFISNGPGNPALYTTTSANIRKVIEDGSHSQPIFGICLGNQLVSQAAGAKCVKLPFGNRGQNQPVRNTVTGEAYITPQNHGYAVCSETLPEDWKTLFVNINDGTNEGIVHKTRPIFTAQFHPEACGGPTDTAFFFDVFLQNIKNKSKTIQFPAPKARAEEEKPLPKKVLLLGSGGLSIGQAGEFDYSGSQAIKALKEEGVHVVLMNPNIASVQTNVEGWAQTKKNTAAAEGASGAGAGAAGGEVDVTNECKADHVFFLPVNEKYVEEVIKREKPDGIVISMGGQTALNVGVSMWNKGLLQKYGVRVLGTSIDAVVATEDREIFADKLKEIDEKIAPSIACTSLKDAVVAAKEIGYPLMIRSAFALGGLGSGICKDEAQLLDMGRKAFSLTNQVLVEKSLKGWKEVEYEVVRDSYDNCITVCNMENFDPLGVHTGDSIVIAPSQTLSNEEYHMLRETAVKVVRHLGIVGECNIQYALDPKSLEYCIIEVNARLSRSSALASKATGYPLAFVAAKLSMGIPLPEIHNAITMKTKAMFEPSLDYCVTKIPRWDLAKFAGVSTEIGSAMKSVGEVMAIGRTFEESMQKAMRMVDPSIEGFQPLPPAFGVGAHFQDEAEVQAELENPSDRRVYAIAEMMKSGKMSVHDIHEHSKIDKWFLRRLERISNYAKTVTAKGLTLESISKGEVLEGKQLGYSDKQIAALLKPTTADGNGSSAQPTELDVRGVRKSMSIRPWVKQIDTLAAEYPAQTNYLYTTYHGLEDDVGTGEKGVVVLGSGAYRIGSSVEFDWCGVSCVRALQRMGKRTIMINYNPETVSTDYDECDQLYFEELSRERVLDIYERENADGVIVGVGGQIPNNLAMPLHKSGAGVKIMGTSPEMIDNAEDRFKFSALVDSLGLQQPPWKELSDVNSATAFANQVGYPVLVRPSYVLSGAAMNVAFDDTQLRHFLGQAADVSQEHPVVVSKFIDGAKEVEMDAVGCNGEVVASAIHEHVENAGVHSGDATLVLPPQSISPYSLHRIEEATKKIAKGLNITGPFNMQFIVKGKDCMVIECNLRASRSVPFVSKTMGVDFIEAATRVMAGEDPAQVKTQMDLPGLGTRNRPQGYVGVKAPMFSFTRLRGADPVLGVEMASTGEVACFGVDKHEAFLKALISTGFKLPEKTILCSVQEKFMDDFVHVAFNLNEIGYDLYCTKLTYDKLEAAGVKSTLVDYPLDMKKSEKAGRLNAVNMIQDGKINLVINLPSHASTQLKNNYLMRRTAVDFGVPLLTNIHLATLFAEAVGKREKFIGLDADSLFDLYTKENAEDTWSGATEFH